MKKLKKLLLSLLLLLSVSFIQSCSVDDNDINYITEFGTVSHLAQNDNEYYQFNGDHYGLSNLLNKNALKYTQTDSVGQRVLYTYCVEQENKNSTIPQNAKQNIRIYDIYKILTKKMNTLDPSLENDDFGKDPIHINGMYISSEHLNIQFSIRRNSPNIAHRISLVGMEGVEPDENGVLNLDLRHNMFDDNPYHLNTGYVSYTLESIPGYNEGTLKKLIINCQSTDGTKQHEINITTENKQGTMKTISCNEIVPII